MLILLIGSGTFATYQILSLEDQLDEVTRAVDRMDPKVKLAQYERAKFYALANDVLRLSSRDTNAEQVVTDFNLKKVLAAQTSMPSPAPVTNAATGMTPSSSAATNAISAPATPSAK